MEIKTDNITALLQEQIKKFDLSVDVSEVGEVIEIGGWCLPAVSGS